MIVKLLSEHHSEFLSLTEGCIGSFESTLVKLPHCWKSQLIYYMTSILVLIGFSLTVKAATLIFISGRGLAISSAKQGKSGSIYYLVKNFKISCLGRTNVCAFRENLNCLHTKLTFTV